MTFEIEPIAEDHIASFHEMFDFVARERKFLAFRKAPPLEAISQFILNNTKERYPQFVVLSAGAVVGWCDVTPDRTRLTYAHRGTLGIGLFA
jgi:hypothetical protein